MYHVPVLVHKAVDFLITRKDGLYLDGTLGGGGHAAQILQRIERPGQLIGADLDDEAIQFNQGLLEQYEGRFIIVQENFKNIAGILQRLQRQKLHGVLLDLGVSSHQLDTPQRGFSFDAIGRLDMRMDRQQDLSAYEVVNSYEAEQLRNILRQFGEVRNHRAVADAIVHAREKGPIETTLDLKTALSRILPYAGRAKSLARIFQALRIEVNAELRNLQQCLRDSLSFLVNGGRIVVISYHSLEDRIVKSFFRSETPHCICPPDLPVCVCSQTGTLRILSRKTIGPAAAETAANPRSRSARLRAAEVIEPKNERPQS